MVLHDPQDFGGLEEYAATLAIGLKRQGQDVSVLSTTWVPRKNQYVCRLIENGVTYVQVPKWLSRPASNWDTKQQLLKIILWLAIPLIFLMAVGLVVIKYTHWQEAWVSAHGWLRGQIQYRFIAENRYRPLTRMLLNWWNIRWHPELFHLQGYTTTLHFAIEWAYQHKIPVVYEEHQTPDARFDWWKDSHESINKANRVVAVSETSADALRDVCKVTQPIFVRNPLLPDPIAAGWEKIKQPPHANEALEISTVARLVPPKGLNYLLDTIAIVKKYHPLIQFKVYGDGSQRSELLTYAHELGLNGNEIFVGQFTTRQELNDIMAKTDIFVMSSILEGQPLSVVEAMAFGCPVVTTSVGGIPELIQDGVNGLLCPPRDPECLAKKITTLIEDPTLRIKLGKAARNSYERGPYQPAAVCTEFIALYSQILQEQGVD